MNRTEARKLEDQMTNRAVVMANTFRDGNLSKGTRKDALAAYEAAISLAKYYRKVGGSLLHEDRREQ